MYILLCKETRECVFLRYVEEVPNGSRPTSQHLERPPTPGIRARVELIYLSKNLGTSRFKLENIS
jgi:hypothetical protein